MQCTKTLDLLDAYVDDELSADEAVAIGAHLTECASCSRRYEGLVQLRMRIHETVPRFVAPDVLRARVREAVRLEVAAAALEGSPQAIEPQGVVASPPGRPVTWDKRARWSRWSWRVQVAAAVVVAVLLGAGGMYTVGRVGDRARTGLADAVLTSHIRSLMAEHLTDVASTDQHTVRPWFAGKLDFSPSVYSFDAQGFPLVGGRLDYVGDRVAAALVYHRRAHVINMFIWPVAGGAVGTSSIDVTAERGYTMLHWRGGGMEHWVASDVNPTDLRAFAALVRGADSTADAGR